MPGKAMLLLMVARGWLGSIPSTALSEFLNDERGRWFRQGAVHVRAVAGDGGGRRHSAEFLAMFSRRTALAHSMPGERSTRS